MVAEKGLSQTNWEKIQMSNFCDGTGGRVSWLVGLVTIQIIMPLCGHILQDETFKIFRQAGIFKIGPSESKSVNSGPYTQGQRM